ncbi:glycosyltransferase [Kitasatospora sp. NPDC096147]|uniref:glycosyltransferase n=1 Tax=Kitasatospora sp. NPDC096147 TaxID=3364093 RepID=UPI003811D417
MRVLLLAYGSRGDVEPMVGLALALREAGAEVRFCAPPDFAGLVAESGLELVPLGRSLRETARQAVLGTGPVMTLQERAALVVAETYAQTLPAAEGCDAVVATGLVPAAAAARTVADRLGVPYSFVAYFPSYLPSADHPPLPWPGHPLPVEETDNRVLWQQNEEVLDELFRDAVNVHRTSVGLEPVAHVRPYVLTDRPLLAADADLSPWQPTDELAVVQTGAFVRPDDRPLPDALEEFLTAGEAPVYVGFGSMPVRDAEAVARNAVAAVRAQGRRVLLARGWAELATGPAADVHLLDEVNQQALFRRVAAVVHHGGAGTTTTAAGAGAPQVLVPQMADQPYWARRVAKLGVGVAHDGPVPTFDSLSAALAVALAPETADRARALAGRLRTDGAATAARLLLAGGA